MQRHDWTWFKGLFAAATVLALGACTPLSSESILWNRTHLNAAIQQTDAQQLLLNIVRQRYNDPVLFVDIGSISSSMSRSASLNLSAFLPTGPARNSFTTAI